MWLIVGLGNGPEYSSSRHNVGWAAVDRLADHLASAAWQHEHHCETSSARIGNEPVVLAKPQLLMNSIGEAVGELVRALQLAPERVIVVYDDFDFRPGQARVRVGGGHGRHNGLKSLFENIGQEFARIRIGIGKPDPGRGLEYVLSPFDDSQLVEIAAALAKTVTIIETIVSTGIQEAMNRFNSDSKVGASGA